MGCYICNRRLQCFSYIYISGDNTRPIDWENAFKGITSVLWRRIVLHWFGVDKYVDKCTEYIES